MPLPGKYSPIDIKPLTGLFDVRSAPDAVRAGTWRWRQNVAAVDKERSCRRPGWSKLFSNAQYNNEDLHDQLIGLQEYYDDLLVPHAQQTDISTFPPHLIFGPVELADSDGSVLLDSDGEVLMLEDVSVMDGVSAGQVLTCGTAKKVRGTSRQPITLLYAANSTAGERKLIAGTQNRLYALNEGRGNWKIIADAYGGPPERNGISERRWAAAQVEDVVVFVNGYDPVLAWTFDGPTFGCAMQAVAEIASLADIGVTKASVVGSWKGTIFLGDVEMDGERLENMVVWSDAYRPLEFVKTNATTAGFQRLSSTDRIMAFKPLGDVLLIYTTRGIWQVTYVGGDEVFNFRELYEEPENGTGCMAYRFTLASTGQEHIYLGRDGIYAFNLFLPAPERVEWMHAASAEIFDTIDETRCDSHSAWYNPGTEEYWISWVESGFPTRCLVYNTRYRTADIVDHGATAFCTYQRDHRPSIRKWLEDNLICLRSELNNMQDLVTPEVKEGGFCIPETLLDCASEEEEILTVSREQDGAVIVCNVSAGTDEPLTYLGKNLTTKVQNAALAICQNRDLPIYTNIAKDVDGVMAEDYDQPQADALSLCSLLGSTSLDDICHECQEKGVFMFASATDWCLKEYGGVYYRERCTNCTACGTYVRDGYKSILRSGAMDLGWPREDKNSRSLELEYEAEPQALPSAVQMRFGHSAQAVNPNKNGCALVWRELTPKNLVCQSDFSGAEHLANGTRPNRPMAWQFLFTGRFFYLEMSVDGINGATCFSRLSLEVRQKPRSATSG